MNATWNWTAVGERGSITGMRLTVWFYRLCGRRLAALFILPVVIYFFLTDHRGRRASRRYLARLYAWRPSGGVFKHPPGMWHSFRHYWEFAVNTLHRVGFWSDRGDEFDISFNGREHFASLIESKSGAILLGAHFGSFDALRVLAERWNIAVNVLMSTRHAPRINRILRELNPKAAVRIIEVDPTSSRAVFELKACLERGEFVALLADRAGSGSRTRSIHAEFLGRLAAFPVGPFVLASRLDCPVLLMIGVRVGPAAYEVFAEPFADRIVLNRSERSATLHELVVAYASRLEAYCFKAPYQWFNFYDFWGEEAGA